jgi:hypothetical protein
LCKTFFAVSLKVLHRSTGFAFEEAGNRFFFGRSQLFAENAKYTFDAFVRSTALRQVHCAPVLPDGIFFTPKIPIWVNFRKPFNGRWYFFLYPFCLLYGQMVYFWPFGTFCGILVHFSRFGMLYRENLATLLSTSS